MRLYTAGTGRLHSAYSFDFLYARRLDAERVRAVLRQWPDGWPAYAFSNHDAPRAVSRWVEGRDPQAYARLLLLLLVCLRGHVFLYQGEELGLPQAEVPYDRLVDPEARVNWPQTLGRDGARTPMPWRADAPHAGFSTAEPWLPVDPRHPPLSVDAQEGDPASTLHFTRRLLAVRRSLPALRSGDLHLTGTDPDLLVFERRLDGARLLCVFNLGLDDVDIDLPPGGWRVVFATPRQAQGGAPLARLPPCGGFIARLR
jgi:alpha-glucosidase